VSARPIKNARVELSLASKAVGTIKLAASSNTDETGSFPDSINIPEIPPGEYQLVIDSTSTLGQRYHVSSRK